jgi:hypothetical protein
MIKIFKKRVKRSVIWKIPTEELKIKAMSYTSMGQILRDYGFKNKGRNALTLKKRLIEEGIDFSHMKMGIGSNDGRKFWDMNKMTIEECKNVLFVENSTYDRKTVKRYLHHYSVFPYVCSKCHLPPEWNKETLVLTLDHKNGVSNDHRLENLRWLCPNCNSQTETFCGRRSKY